MRHSTSNDRDNSVPKRQLKIPNLPFPKFYAGSNESYRKFIATFEDIIRDFNLNETEKFAFLKDNVFNGAKTLLESLSIAKQKYSVAKDLLTKAFDDPIFNKFEVLEKSSVKEKPQQTEFFRREACIKLSLLFVSLGDFWFCLSVSLYGVLCHACPNMECSGSG